MTFIAHPTLAEMWSGQYPIGACKRVALVSVNLFVCLFVAAGRFDFNQACYDCQGPNCSHNVWQGWREFQQLQLFPASLGPQNCTYAEEGLLILLRRMRHYACGSWKHLAKSFDYTGRALFNQVSRCSCRGTR